MADMRTQNRKRHEDKAIAGLRREMKPPRLQELVERRGTYDKITPEAWATFDCEMAVWKTCLRSGGFSRPPYSDLPPEEEPV